MLFEIFKAIISFFTDDDGGINHPNRTDPSPPNPKPPKPDKGSWWW